MQSPVVSVSFFWLMLFAAFAIGIVVARLIARNERREAVEKARAAAELLHDVSTTLRASPSPLSIYLHRRICDFRARCGL